MFASCRIGSQVNAKTVMDLITNEIEKAVGDNEALPKQTV
jgi:hypothetical protein